MLHTSRRVLIAAASVLFLLALTFPNIVSATSGCCSGHGGVSCSAGPQGNGNVICNDGWRNSSCSYSSMVMCEGVSTQAKASTPAPTPVPTAKPVVYAPALTPKTTATSVPEVKGASTEVSPSPTQVPNSNPNSNVFGWVVLAGIVGFVSRIFTKNV